MKKPTIIRQRLTADDREKLNYLGDVIEPFKAELEFPSDSGGRTKIIALNLYAEITNSSEGTFLIARDQKKSIIQDPHEFIKASLEIDDALFPDLSFKGGVIGFAGYSYSFLFEEIAAPHFNPVGIPDLHFLFHTDYFVYSGEDFSECSHLHLDYEGDKCKDEIRDSMRAYRKKLSCLKRATDPHEYSIQRIQSNTDKNQFIGSVQSLQSNIRNGDIFQAVLSQRWMGTFTGESVNYYKTLKKDHPETFHFHIDFGSYQLVGCSPERLIAINQGIIYSNPIAGTRPRGANDREDENRISSLQNDEKEKAEHVMLVDLARNDLGKICKTESVRIKRYMEIEKFKNVIHLVSEMTGDLKEGVHPMDAVRACLPAGTVSGAPKIRAMELISKAEQERRGAYGGGVGFISYGGEMDLALAIRMAVIKEQTIHFQAGAGVVYDSDPESEWNETLHKAGFKGVDTHDFTYR